MSEVNTGVQAPEAAAPVTTPAAESPVASEQNPAPAAPGADKPTATMPPEERSEFAAARRRAEQQAKAQVKAMREQQDAFAKEMGFESWDKMRQENSKTKLASGEFTPEALAPFVQPLVEKALQAQYGPVIGAVQSALDQADIAQEIAEFQAAYPDEGVKTAADFANKPYFEKFKGYVDRGLTFAEAFELANRAELNAKRTAAAKQAAINNVTSKEHMQPADGGADGIDNTVVPEDTLRWYRYANPNWTDKQIKQHYADFMKGK